MMALFRTRLVGTWLLAALAAGAAGAEVSEGAASEQEYWARIDQRDWLAAANSAEALVEAARASGADPLALAEALSMLGNAQLGAENLAAAEEAFAEALVIAERNSPPMSEKLLEPLRGLGYTLAAAGQHEQAVAVLDRTLKVTHRSVGLFDISQERVLRELAASLLRLGQLAEARQHMRYLVRVSERAYGAEDPRRVPILATFAEWNAETGDVETAREAYRWAIELVENAYGNDSLALIEPLCGLAHSYMLELYLGPLGMLKPRDAPVVGGANIIADDRVMSPRQLPNEGERALERAVQIAESADPPRHDLLRRALLQAGDWFQVKGQSDKALIYYRRAWQAHREAMAKSTDPRSVQALPLLGHPVQVYYPTPPLAARHLGRTAEEVLERYVEVQFTVTSDGAVRDERVIDRDGTNRQAAEALQAIRASRYRPRFVDGEPVETPRMTRRETFRVRR